MVAWLSFCLSGHYCQTVIPKMSYIYLNRVGYHAQSKHNRNIKSCKDKDPASDIRLVNSSRDPVIGMKKQELLVLFSIFFFLVLPLAVMEAALIIEGTTTRPSLLIGDSNALSEPSK